MDTNDTVNEVTKSAKENSENEVKKLLKYGDMEVEVRAEDGNPIFTATLKTEGNSFLFDNITDDTNSQKSPVSTVIRGFSPGSKKTVYMKATLYNRSGKWLSDDLSLTRTASERSFFRAHLNVLGTLQNSGGGAPCPCRVRDISNGGVRLTSWAKYMEGDILTLNAELYGIEADIKCRVIRVSGEGPYTYNCAFIDLNNAMRRKLTRDILNVQFNKN